MISKPQTYKLSKESESTLPCIKPRLISVEKLLKNPTEVTYALAFFCNPFSTRWCFILDTNVWPESYFDVEL